MSGVEILCDFLDRAGKDPRIGPLHIALYTSILKHWMEQGQVSPIVVYGQSLREKAKLSGSRTYHRLINDLTDFDYIGYEPSFNYRKGSKIFIK